MKSLSNSHLLITCEHASCAIPQTYARWFRGQSQILKSHRGWDPGALDLADALAQHWCVPCLATNYSRLLIEPNRSPHHRQLFSEFTADLEPRVKEEILATFYWPHRKRVQDRIERQLKRYTRVVHIGVHTFTPELDGNVRQADVGILYDPKRASEQRFARSWKQTILQAFPAWRVRFNYPYRGAADGLTTSMRALFPADRYLGIELEVNQRFPLSHRRAWSQICSLLAACPLPRLGS